MSSSMLSIHFCGTGVNTDSHTVINGLIKKSVVREVIEKYRVFMLTGVGSKSTKDGDDYYPTPGTFENKNGKRVKELWRMSDNIYNGRLSLGFIFGAGEDQNIEAALSHVDSQLKTSNATSSPVIKISGYSRGAASAIRLANEIYKKYGASVMVDLFLIDPNAGFLRHKEREKINIPPIVKNAYYVFSGEEKLGIIRSQGLEHYVFTEEVQVSALALKGNHIEQVFDTGNASSHQTVEYLLNQFYSHQESDIEDKPDESFMSSLGKSLYFQDATRHLFVNNQSPRSNDMHKLFSRLITLSSDYQKSNNQLQRISQGEIKKLMAASIEASKVANSLKLENTRALAYCTYEYAAELQRAYSSANYDEKDRISDIAKTATCIVNQLLKGEYNIESFNNFKERSQIKSFSSKVRSCAASLCGVIAGILGAVLGALLGLIGGLRRWKTLGLVSLVTIPVTSVKTSMTFYECASNAVKGERISARDRFFDKISCAHKNLIPDPVTSPVKA